MEKPWKKLAGLCLAGLLLFGVTACGKAPAAAKPEEKTAGPYKNLPQVVLVGGDSAGKGSVGQKFGELVARKVEEKSGGRLKIDYHPMRNWEGMKTFSGSSGPMISRWWWARWLR